MHARVTLLEIDTMRVSMDEATTTFREMVVPRLQQQPGYLGVYALGTPEGRAMLVSFWDSAEAAGAGSPSDWYPTVLAEYTTLFRAPPGREQYEVRFADPPLVASETA